MAGIGTCILSLSLNEGVLNEISLSLLVTAVLLLTGCNQPAETDSISGGGGTIEAINHTHWAINHFSVNGQSGVDIIGPWQGGGGAGYFGVPPKWEPGMTVKIDWETGVGDMDGFPALVTMKNSLIGIEK